MYNFHLAIDIGASGGRHILGFEKDGEIHLEEIHRFPNEMKKNEHSQLVWDLDFIWNEIIIGLKKCKTIGKIPKSVGIDTWGVDFVLVDKYGNPTCPTVAYRDNRTDGMDDEVSKYVSETELYNKTGIQKMMFNTIYQLMAIKIKTPQYFADATRLLMIPDYLHYKLCGKIANEYTIASTTGLLNIHTKTWDEKIISRCGFPQEIFSEITPAGTMLGEITEEIQKT
ncbi:MAG: rhamnulokinase, partial [Oscillospiraceae bacterium]|nr:rhamnulokinase [Oscillospiraceae bacterium]